MGHTLKLNVLAPGAAPLDVDALRAGRGGAPVRASRAPPSGSTPRGPNRAGSRRPTSTSAITCAGTTCADCVSRADLWNGRQRTDVRAPGPHEAAVDVRRDRPARRRPRGHRGPHPPRDGRRHRRGPVPRRACSGTPPRRGPAQARRPRGDRAEAGGLGRGPRMPGAVLRELGHPGARSPLDRPITGVARAGLHRRAVGRDEGDRRVAADPRHGQRRPARDRRGRTARLARTSREPRRTARAGADPGEPAPPRRRRREPSGTTTRS